MTSSAARDASARRVHGVSAGRSLQLDLFRGVAAILMIVNHAGFQLLKVTASSTGWPAWLVFVGSAAPALFFFATGVGSGFGSGGSEAIASMSRKVLLLLLADTLMNWSAGVLLGLDFFGFAAVATFVLFLVKRARHPERVALVLLAAVLVARFGVVAIARGRIPEDSVAAFVTGIVSVRHVSYPLAPWLAFPLLGFLAGRRWRQEGSDVEVGVLAIAGASLLGAFALLASHGAPVFRWGSVSIAYFLCAVGIVATLWLAAQGLARTTPVLARALSLRGPASLLMVPLHYGALGLLEDLSPPPWTLAAWMAGTVLLIAAVFMLSRGVIAWARRSLHPGMTAQVAIAGVTCAVGLAACLRASPLLRLEICSAGEVVIGLLLLWSSRPREVEQRGGAGATSANLP